MKGPQTMPEHEINKVCELRFEGAKAALDDVKKNLSEVNEALSVKGWVSDRFRSVERAIYIGTGGLAVVTVLLRFVDFAHILGVK